MTFERSQFMNRFVLVLVSALVLFLSACGGGSSTPPGNNPPGNNPPGNNPPGNTPPENQASFSIVGTWVGTGTDDAGTFEPEDDITRTITFVFTNNGGDDGQKLTGTLTIEGVVTIPFTDGYIYPLPGSVRTFALETADNDGYTYYIGGEMTEKRLDNPTIQFKNPALARLDVGDIVKQ
jgi:hypothetical protein